MEVELYSFFIPASETGEIRQLAIYLESGLFIVKCISNLDDFSFKIKFDSLYKALSFSKTYLLNELESLFI